MPRSHGRRGLRHGRRRVRRQAPRRGRWITGLLVALASALLLCAEASALDPRHRIEEYTLQTWTEEDGLPQNSVEALAQSREGYLWLGTQEGLVRFDGVRFALLDRANTPALRSNHISSLVPAPESGIWVGTFGGGLLLLDEGELRAAPTGEPEADAVNVVVADADGTLWLGTDQGEVVRRSPSGTRVLGSADGVPFGDVTGLFRDRRGRLWASSASGLAYLEGEHFLSVRRADGLPSETITTLGEDCGGRFWVGTSAGPARLAEGSALHFEVPPELEGRKVWALLCDRDASFWLGTDNGLLRLRRNGEGSEVDEGLVGTQIGVLYEDREGSLWLGTDGQGLAQLRHRRVVSYGALQGLQGEAITVTGASAGGLWVGTDAGRVYRFSDRRFTPLPRAPALSGNRIFTLEESRDGSLWIGSRAGLWQFSDGQYRRIAVGEATADPAVRALYEDEKGALWVGLEEGGLFRLAGGQQSRWTSREGLAGDMVRALRPSREGGLWIGTYGGLSHWREGRLTNLTSAQGLPSRFVRALHEDEDGTLWIGTYGGGLIRYRDGRFTHYTTRDGLANEIIFQILDDDLGRLWFSCNKGIFSVEREQLEAFAAGRLERIACESFDRSDGMASRECNGGKPAGWRTPDGRLWFPTLKGLAAVDPSEQLHNELPPPVALERVLFDGEPQAWEERLELPPGRHRVEIEFTALSLLAPEKNRFRHQLIGFDDEWVEAGTRRSAQYTNLPPGRYSFRVIAANADGVWNEAGADLELAIPPHLWQRRSIHALLLMLVGLSIYGLFRWRLATLARRERELTRRVEEAVAEIKVLGGLLPICSHCKKIRDDRGYWRQLEIFLREHSEARLSHGICPECMARFYPGLPSSEGRPEGGD